MTKERSENLRPNDNVVLRRFIFNGGIPADPFQVNRVKIYQLFVVDPTVDNPYGKSLIQTIGTTDIVKDSVGQYSIQLSLMSPLYTTGKYTDEWEILFEVDLPVAIQTDYFQIYTNAWFTDTKPLVYDFNFDFNPDRIQQGSKKYLQVQLTPNIPRGTDKQRYYENLVYAGNLYLNIEQACGPCVPEEQDLRLIVNREPMIFKDFLTGYYFLDTSSLNCGIYNIWFEFDLGENVYISDKQPLQIVG
jgi:hypothetical protein